MEDATALQPLDLQDGLADRGDLLGEERLDAAADHLLDDLVHRHLVGAVRRDVGAVAHDGQGVAEVEDLLEPVGDEHDPGTTVAQAPCDTEEPFDLDTGQSRGRLVHHEEASIERDGLRDLDDLLIGDGQALGQPVGVDRDAEAGEELSCLLAHPTPVDQAEAAERLASDEDVLGHGQVGEERRLLVDHGHAGGLRVGRRREVDLLAVESEDPAVASVEPGDDLHHRGLACAVLPDQGVDRP